MNRLWHSLSERIPSEYIARVCSMPANDDLALDLGCGSGRTTKLIGSYFNHTIGIDHDVIAVAQARESAGEGSVAFATESVERFLDEFPGSVDLLFAYEAMHLFSEPAQLIANFRRVLSPGAALVVGWRRESWETEYEFQIRDIFMAAGIPLTPWWFWTCPWLSGFMASVPGWRAGPDIAVAQRQSWTANEIVDILTQMSVSVWLPDEIHQDLKCRLTDFFEVEEGLGHLKGSCCYEASSWLV
jgi:SAM-dependent methyltransferase